MSQKDDRDVLHLRIPRSIHLKIKSMAMRLGVSMSYIVQKALEKKFKRS